jgi:competence protein ComEA
MAGKPTDVIEDWTYGPVRWIGAGLIIGASAVGIAWSISARRVPVAAPIPVQAATGASAPLVNQVTSQPPKLAPVHAPKPIVTELPPREAPVQVVAITDQPRAVEPIAIAEQVNVNTATTQQLETLPGIGPGLAAKIVEDRSRNGRFRSLADLDRVPGIGPKLLEKMRPLVAFE